jgi:C-type mannose receptor
MSVSLSGFSWEDGSAVDFTNWGYNEPNDKYHNEDCVGFYNTWSPKWNDWNCYDIKNYICRIPKGVFNNLFEILNFGN